MFSITVSKVGADKQATITASHRQALIDHLVASAGRHGFEVPLASHDDGGDILRDGQIVAEWEITRS
ncbi:hypothetical protein SEA_ACOLYTE_84 [Mycobacterium phage Acolyte]|nr:hypothetical protein SEA_ACOLYTE_84 [Mycobacterium phage Acolyte]